MSRLACVLILFVAGCAQVGTPCLLPSDLAIEEKISPLPENDVSLSEALRIWRIERGEYRKLADRKNDTVRYVRENCQ